MLLKFLVELVVVVFSGLGIGSTDTYTEGPNSPVNETSSPAKITHVVTKKDSTTQTQTPIVIFKLINTGSGSSTKNNGSLKNAGKLARTANTKGISVKI